MSAQIFGFPGKGKIAWHHIAGHVRNVALERSGSQEIAERVVEVVRQAYERSVPEVFSFQTEPVQSAPADEGSPFVRTAAQVKSAEPPSKAHLQIFSDHLNKVVGGLIKELTIIATDAEMAKINDHPER